MAHRAFIGLGSNLGDRKANILEAIDRIRKLPATRIVKQSSLYESEPHGDATDEVQPATSQPPHMYPSTPGIETTTPTPAAVATA